MTCTFLGFSVHFTGLVWPEDLFLGLSRPDDPLEAFHRVSQVFFGKKTFSRSGKPFSDLKDQMPKIQRQRDLPITFYDQKILFEVFEDRKTSYRFSSKDLWEVVYGLNTSLRSSITRGSFRGHLWHFKDTLKTLQVVYDYKRIDSFYMTRRLLRGLLWPGHLLWAEGIWGLLLPEELLEAFYDNNIFY